MQSALEQRQHLRCQSTRARTNFQDAQSAPLGKVAGDFLHGTGDCRQPWAGDETVSVKLIQKIRSAAGEEDMHSVLLATKDGTEFRAGGAAKQSLWKMARVRCNARAQQLGCGVCGERKRRRWPIAFAFIDQQVALPKAGRQLRERRLHGCCHAERVRRKYSIRPRPCAHLAQADRDLGRRQCISRRIGGFQMGASPHLEDFIQGLLRHVMQAAQRHRCLLRGPGCCRGFFPGDVIDQVTTFSGPARAACAFHTDRPEAVNPDTGPARLII